MIYLYPRQSLCIFRRMADGTNRCRQCGFVDQGRSPPERTFRYCPDGHERWYDVFPLALNFAWAWAKHLLAGLPVTPEHAREQRFAVCQSCRHWTGAKCGKCGCPVTTTEGWRDKLGWADQSCPIGKWGPVRLPKQPRIRKLLEVIWPT